MSEPISARERGIIADKAAEHLPDTGRYYVGDDDIAAMRAAFRRRFDEELPRTETLFAVARIGYRMALRDIKARKALP